MVKSFLRRVYSSFATNVLDVPPRLLAFLLFLLLLFIPVMKPESYILLILITANIYAIFAASWDILVGRAGQLSLGHALFFGIGAYSSALLYRFYKLPLWATIPLGVFFCVLIAVLVGFPCLRVKGPYLALVTLAFPLILYTMIFALPVEIAGGEHGIWGLPRFFPFLDVYQQKVAEYYLSFFLLFVSSITLYKIANSKTGIVFVSILDDELASKACGIDTTKYKLLAFAISAFFASLAGGLYAHSSMSMGNVAPSGTLSLTISFTPVIMTILGGIGTIYGPIVGAYTLMTLVEFLRVAEEWRLLLYVIVVIIFIVKWPTGVARFVAEKLEELKEEK